MDTKDTMQLLVSDITQISSEIYYEGMIGLSAELRSTRENTDSIRTQMDHANSELAKANMMLRESHAKSDELDNKLRSALAKLAELKKALRKLILIPISFMTTGDSQAPRRRVPKGGEMDHGVFSNRVFSPHVHKE